MNAFEFLLGLFFWPLQTILDLATTKVGLSIIFIFLVLFVLIGILAPPTDKTVSTAKKSDKPTELSAGAYMFIGWGVWSLLTSRSKSNREIDQEAEPEVETQQALIADKSMSKAQPQRSIRTKKRAEKRTEQKAKKKTNKRANKQVKKRTEKVNFAKQNELELKQEQIAFPEQEVQLKSVPESQPELNLSGLGSLLINEMVRSKDEDGERLTVKKGIEALGGVDAIDAYFRQSKSDKT